LELRARQSLPGDLRTRQLLPAPLRVSSRKITLRLDLPDSAGALWERFDAKLRTQIRRPQKEGLEARFGPDQLDAFYEVFAINMRALGTPVLPRRFFERIAERFPRVVVFGAVYRAAQPLAAGCGFVWREEFEMTWASSLREYNRLAPNMLLYWSFLEHVIGRGVRVFDFGRCTPGGGTHRFKQQWGAADVPLSWLQWSSRAVAATPSPDRPAFRVASAVWRQLTLALRAAAATLGGGEPPVVALPAYACYDVATAAVAVNARIALYDVHPATLAPDLASLTATLAEGARIVVVAPLYGMPVDWDAIEQCVAAFGALAIEDAAQGHGASWRGRPLGSLGRLSVLSFSRGKGW